MDRPLISCIVPVFNGELYLQEALDSILGQTYRPLQVILADDGSTDGTAKIAASYGEQVEYLFQPNGGPAAARNLGLSTARGEFIAFLDADDIWHERKLELQMARFAARPELGACVTHAKNFWIPELSEERERYRGRLYEQALPAYTGTSLMARRTVFDLVGQFDTSLRLGEDNDWFLRAADHAVVIECLPEVLAYRRVHHSNTTRAHLQEIPEALLRIVKMSLDRRRARRRAE